MLRPTCPSELRSVYVSCSNPAPRLPRPNLFWQRQLPQASCPLIPYSLRRSSCAISSPLPRPTMTMPASAPPRQPSHLRATPNPSQGIDEPGLVYEAAAAAGARQDPLKPSTPHAATSSTTAHPAAAHAGRGSIDSRVSRLRNSEQRLLGMMAFAALPLLAVMGHGQAAALGASALSHRACSIIPAAWPAGVPLSRKEKDLRASRGMIPLLWLLRLELVAAAAILLPAAWAAATSAVMVARSALAGWSRSRVHMAAAPSAPYCGPPCGAVGPHPQLLCPPTIAGGPTAAPTAWAELLPGAVLLLSVAYLLSFALPAWFHSPLTKRLRSASPLSSQDQAAAACEPVQAVTQRAGHTLQTTAAGDPGQALVTASTPAATVGASQRTAARGTSADVAFAALRIAILVVWLYLSAVPAAALPQRGIYLLGRWCLEPMCMLVVWLLCLIGMGERRRQAGAAGF